MAGGNSYNGWPANSDPNAIGIDKNWGAKVGAPPFGSGGFPGGVKSGDVSTLFVYLVNRLHNEVEPMMNQAGGLGYGCWGYSYRDNVNNPGSLSCHASGTAIDYNAPKHPNGTSTGPSGGGGWSGDQYNAIKAILNGPLQGGISWLTSNDPMHFEIKGNASKIASIAKSLGGSTPPPQTGDWFDMATKEELAAVVAEQISAQLGNIGIAVWSTVINERGAANAMINQASAMSQAAADAFGPLPVRIWTTPITDLAANTLLAMASTSGSAADAAAAAGQVVEMSAPEPVTLAADVAAAPEVPAPVAQVPDPAA